MFGVKWGTLQAPMTGNVRGDALGKRVIYLSNSCALLPDIRVFSFSLGDHPCASGHTSCAEFCSWCNRGSYPDWDHSTNHQWTVVSGSYAQLVSCRADFA